MIRKTAIAISKLSTNYEDWLKKLNPGLDLVNFDSCDPGDFRRTIGEFSGLVLSGGGDIHPSLYGNPDTGNQCQGIDVKRDELEFSMIEAALIRKLPILAICRGLQVLNVFLGGTLIPHIPDLHGKVMHKDIQDVNHPVIVYPDSQLYRITETINCTVNSSHHQAIENPGSGLVITAYSEDGIAEAAELKEPGGFFCLAVQWHPERMDFENPLSGKLGMAFMKTVTEERD